MEFKRVLKKDGKLSLVNMTEGVCFGNKLYDFVYNISPKTMGGCRGVKLTEKLQQHGFKVEVREYVLKDKNSLFVERNIGVLALCVNNKHGSTWCGPSP